MIRSITPEDTAAVLDVAEASALFQPAELGLLAHMLEEHFNAEDSASDLWMIREHNEQAVGIIYAAPERMTDGTWNIYMIAVRPEAQRHRHGSAMLRHMEQVLRDLGVRLVLVETSGSPAFDHVRSFYRNHGYEEEARIREFYAAGDDKIVFRKALTTSGQLS